RGYLLRLFVAATTKRLCLRALRGFITKRRAGVPGGSELCDGPLIVDRGIEVGGRLFEAGGGDEVGRSGGPRQSEAAAMCSLVAIHRMVGLGQQRFVGDAVGRINGGA